MSYLDDDPAERQRVSEKIARHILAFCAGRLQSGRPEFHMETLRQHVIAEVPETAPDSPSRILRDLRQKGTVPYIVLSRSASLYRLLTEEQVSSTNRGKQYERLARYYSPWKIPDKIVRRLPVRPGDHVYEGHVGGGSWAERFAYLSTLGVPTSLEVNDLDPEAPGLNSDLYMAGIEAWEEWAGPNPPYEAFTQHIGSFLDVEPREQPQWIPGNPPYAIPQPPELCIAKGCVSKTEVIRPNCKKCKGTGKYNPRPLPVAEKHVRRALELVAPCSGNVVYLLRSAFAESGERIPFWEQYPSRHRWDLAERPSFDGDGTDSCAYSVFWWDLQWIADGHKNGDGTWESLSWDN